MHDYGRLFLSTSYVESNTIAKLQREAENDTHFDSDVGFWVGLRPEGAMKSIKSLLPVSLVPKSLGNDFIAMEVILKNGKKHVIFRGFVTVINDTTMKLDISVCHMSLLDDKSPTIGKGSGNVIFEEIFENQYYQPMCGWGDKPTQVDNKDPKRWSTNDFSYSSNVSVIYRLTLPITTSLLLFATASMVILS